MQRPPIQRPTRNLFIIMSVTAALYLVLTRLPWAIVIWLLAGMVVLVAALALWGRDLLIGHRCTRKRQWAQAAQRYQLFEAKLQAAPWRKLAVLLHFGIYTFDGVAMARNHVAQSLIQLGELESAERWLKGALQRDPLYPLPYLNLGVIAALRGEQPRVAREVGKAVRLGLDPEGAQRMLRRAVASAQAKQ